jgi:hypothetical protein
MIQVYFIVTLCLNTLNGIIQTEINKITDWLNVNKLSINTKKTKFVLFKSPNKRTSHDIKLSMNNDNIKQVKSITFLGIVVDECLTWKYHIKLVSKKIIKATAIISKIRYFTNVNYLKLIYYALVYPYLIYANLIWGNTYKTHIQKLFTIQKKLVRLITFSSYFEHTDPIFKKLKILNIYKINEYLTSLFMFRYYKVQNLPEIFCNYFVSNNEIHHHNTRNASLLHKSYKRTNYTKHSLANKGIGIWNGLAKDFKQIKSHFVFKREVKKDFLHI